MGNDCFLQRHTQLETLKEKGVTFSILTVMLILKPLPGSDVPLRSPISSFSALAAPGNWSKPTHRAPIPVCGSYFSFFFIFFWEREFYVSAFYVFIFFLESTGHGKVGIFAPLLSHTDPTRPARGEVLGHPMATHTALPGACIRGGETAAPKLCFSPPAPLGSHPKSFGWEPTDRFAQRCISIMPPPFWVQIGLF